MVIETPRILSPFALLTPFVRRMRSQSRLSSSARAVVMMSIWETRRMAALCCVLGGAAPGPWSAWLSGLLGASARKRCRLRARELWTPGALRQGI